MFAVLYLNSEANTFSTKREWQTVSNIQRDIISYVREYVCQQDQLPSVVAFWLPFTILASNFWDELRFGLNALRILLRFCLHRYRKLVIWFSLLLISTLFYYFISTGVNGFDGLNLWHMDWFKECLLQVNIIFCKWLSLSWKLVCISFRAARLIEDLVILLLSKHHVGVLWMKAKFGHFHLWFVNIRESKVHSLVFLSFVKLLCG